MVATNSGSEGIVSASMGDGETAGAVRVGTTTVSVGGAGGGVELILVSWIEGAEQLTSINVTVAAKVKELKRMF